jgi:hypothetical protein
MRGPHYVPGPKSEAPHDWCPWGVEWMTGRHGLWEHLDQFVNVLATTQLAFPFEICRHRRFVQTSYVLRPDACSLTMPRGATWRRCAPRQESRKSKGPSRWTRRAPNAAGRPPSSPRRCQATLQRLTTTRAADCPERGVSPGSREAVQSSADRWTSGSEQIDTVVSATLGELLCGGSRKSVLLLRPRVGCVH